MTRDRLSARVRANRANARKSTGPKTEEGRARVARNALAHGLSSAQQPAHEPEVIAALMDVIRADYPLAAIDAQWLEPVIYRVADALLTLLKIRKLRNEVWRQSNDPDAARQSCPNESSPFSLVLDMLLTPRSQEAEMRDPLQNLKRLDRYERRAATRYRQASKALAELLAAHAPRASTGAPQAE